MTQLALPTIATDRTTVDGRPWGHGAIRITRVDHGTPCPDCGQPLRTHDQRLAHQMPDGRTICTPCARQRAALHHPDLLPRGDLMTPQRPSRRRTPRPDPTTIHKDLTSLATKVADHLPAVIEILTDAADIGYPSNASGADSAPGSGGLTQPERLTAHPDQAAARALSQLVELEEFAGRLRRIERIIDANARNRAVKRCPACEAPWDEDRWGNACRAQLPSGGACGHVIGIDLDADTCATPNCGKPLKVGDRVKSTVDGKERCVTCASYFRRYEREKTFGATGAGWHTTDDYQLDTERVVVFEPSEEIDA